MESHKHRHKRHNTDVVTRAVSIKDNFVLYLHVKLEELSKQWMTHVILLVAMILYTAAGAIMYYLIEGTSESLHVSDILFQRKVVMTKIHELVKTGSPMLMEKSEELIKEYEKKLVEHYDQNSKLLTRGDDELLWSFWGAAFFCGTIYTTIGYGHLAPLTTAGRALTIVYALIGVPLFLTLLADFGKMFTRWMKFFIVMVNRIYATGSVHRKHKNMDEDTSYDDDSSDDFENETILLERDEYDFSLPISLALLFFVIYMIFGAVIYYLVEEWTFIESLYFIFISMATIGFGDFVPTRHFDMMVLLVYLICGLSITSMCINVVQEKMSETFEHATARIKEKVGLEHEDPVQMHNQMRRYSRRSISSLSSTPFRSAHNTYRKFDPKGVVKTVTY